MERQDLFALKNKQKKIKMSAAVEIDALRVD